MDHEYSSIFWMLIDWGGEWLVQRWEIKIYKYYKAKVSWQSYVSSEV